MLWAWNLSFQQAPRLIFTQKFDSMQILNWSRHARDAIVAQANIARLGTKADADSLFG